MHNIVFDIENLKKDSKKLLKKFEVKYYLQHVLL